jgi:hypothetical protein
MKQQIAIITEDASKLGLPETSPEHPDAYKITGYDSGSRKWLVNHIAWAVANNKAVVVIPLPN